MEATGHIAEELTSAEIEELKQLDGSNDDPDREIFPSEEFPRT